MKKAVGIILLFAVFCLAYPVAVTGVAFDVRPPFSLSWAGSALLLHCQAGLWSSWYKRYGEKRENSKVKQWHH